MPFCKNCGKEIENGEVCEQCSQTEVVEAEPIVEKKDNPKLIKGLVIATAILYPLISIVIAVINFISGNTELYKFILSLLFSGITAICVLMGGFYLIVIYLYFIYLFRVGCDKTNIPLWKRIVLGICAVVAYVLSILFIYI